MNTAVYLQSNLVPLFALLILLANARRRLPPTRENILFQVVAALTVCDLCLDMGCAAVAGSGMPGAVRTAWILNVAFYVVGGLTSLCWYLFVHGSMHGSASVVPRTWRGAMAVGPYLAYAAALMSSPWTHAIFSVDADGHYVRGPFFGVIFAVSLAYALIASGEALAKRRKTSDPVQRLRCVYLALFPVPMICAGLLQMLFSAVSFLVPGLAVSILLVYFDLQRGRMVRDGLTGLCNRGRFDQLLEERCARPSRRRAWCLVMIDIDDFKAINDGYGHAVGDRVLRQTAEALRKAFHRERELVARFGGDEFAVLLDAADPRQVEERLCALDEVLSNTPVPGGPGGIEASAGVAFVRDASLPKEVVRRADAAMYERKRARKASRETEGRGFGS